MAELLAMAFKGVITIERKASTPLLMFDAKQSAPPCIFSFADRLIHTEFYSFYSEFL
jgi:hypothetical protein